MKALREFVLAHRASLVVGSGLAGAALVNYLYHIVAARVMGPEAYGAFGALLGAFTVATGLGTIVQNLVATQTTAFGPVPGVLRGSRRLALLSGLATLALVVAVAPAAGGLLRIEGFLPFLVLGLAAAAVFLQAAEVGFLQGTERTAALATNYVAAAGSRFVVGIALVVAGLGVGGAVAGLAAGGIGGALAARLVVKPREGPSDARWVVGPAAYGVAYTALLALTNVDLVAARWALPPADAGAYAFAAAVGRLVLLVALPVVVANFPRLVRGETDARRQARLLILLAGLGLVAGLFLLRDLVTALMGEAYAPSAAYLPWYALAALPYALVHVEIVRAAAVRPRATAGALLGVFALEVALFATFHGSAFALVASLAACGVLSLAAVAAAERLGPDATEVSRAGSMLPTSPPRTR